MLTMRFSWRFHHVLGSLMLAAGLLLSQSLSATALPGSSPDTDSLANDVDLRPAFKKWGLGTRLQGNRNTCSVFTVAEAMEYALASKRGGGKRLSAEFLNWASNQALGTMSDGSFFSDLWKGFMIYGVCPEEDMPYQDKFDAGLKPSQEAVDHALELLDAGLRLHWIKPWNPKTGLTEEEFLAVKRTLNRQWPVCGGFRWPKNVWWKDDILEMAPPDGVVDGHSVLIVGYRRDVKPVETNPARAWRHLMERKDRLAAAGLNGEARRFHCLAKFSAMQNRWHSPRIKRRLDTATGEAMTCSPIWFSARTSNLSSTWATKTTPSPRAAYIFPSAIIGEA